MLVSAFRFRCHCCLFCHANHNDFASLTAFYCKDPALKRMCQCMAITATAKPRCRVRIFKQGAASQISITTNNSKTRRCGYALFHASNRISLISYCRIGHIHTQNYRCSCRNTGAQPVTRSDSDSCRFIVLWGLSECQHLQIAYHCTKK